MAELQPLKAGEVKSDGALAAWRMAKERHCRLPEESTGVQKSFFELVKPIPQNRALLGLQLLVAARVPTATKSVRMMTLPR